jgi:hypothetical protein
LAWSVALDGKLVEMSNNFALAKLKACFTMAGAKNHYEVEN